MIRPQRYFPWKVARQFYFGHLIFVLVTLVLTGFSLRYYVYSSFLRTNDIALALGRFDSYLTSLFITVLVGAAIYLAISTRYYSRPLGRLIQRARELRRYGAVSADNVDAEELNEEPGEWYDLDRALNRIHFDLRTKTDDLLREREELSALIGAVSDAILATDREGNPLFFNSQFAVLFRVAEKGQKALSLNEMFRVPEVLEGYKRVLESGEMQTVSAVMHSAHHSIPRHYSIAIAPLRMREEGSVYGALGIFHDVTELKQSEQIRIEFVGNASHELRTPLTSIKGYVETLREDLKNQRYDSAGQFLDIVSKNVDRLIFLVNDLLDLSTLESGAELEKSTISTREITETALKQLEAKRAAKRQEIQTRFTAETLFADPRRVEQVLVNLVQNAVKYIPEGSRIEISWDNEGTKTCLRVKDNGPGVPPEHQARLFERFYRVDTGRARDQGGTGLGLAIVKHIMIKHGGNVRVQSRPGEGSEFICTFP